jgi:hypothetical protein
MASDQPFDGLDRNLREPNDDRAQYLVTAASYVSRGARSFVELVTSFEHDKRDEQHRIRVSLASPRSYKLSPRVTRPAVRR